MTEASAAKRLRVGVIFGGRSGEHEVSLLSASSVIDALDPARYEVVPIGISRSGRWLAGPAALQCLRAESVLPSSGAMGVLAARATVDVHQGAVEVGLLPDPGRRGVMALAAAGSPPPGTLGDLDVVFPVLHGPQGEDGTIQGLLELAGLPYVGAGVLGSALGMDKIAMKDVFRAHGLPVVHYLPIARVELEAAPEAVRDRVLAALQLPYFVKPSNLGSSVGITKVRSADGLLPALRQAATYDRRLLVEESAGDAMEIECSVLGNDQPEASVPGEVIPSREFYDYHAKYIDEGSRLVIPAPLPYAVAERVRQLAVQAFLAIDCAGMARVDFFVRRSDYAVIINELNTIPGFTSISMYPKLWAASGLSYERLLDRLIQLAIERQRDRARSLTSYSPFDAPVEGGRC